MNSKVQALMVGVLRSNGAQIIEEWMKEQQPGDIYSNQVLTEDELRQHCQDFLQRLRSAIENGGLDRPDGPVWDDVKELLGEISQTRSRMGFSPSQTATFVFSFKQPFFRALRDAGGNQAESLVEYLWQATLLLDKLGLYTIEVYQQTRESVIQRQQQEMLELSTPVVELWDNILALPMIGTLDSARTQIVMETLLQRIVETGSEIAVIDITGVPTVDTLTAQHLLKTVAAARLMGADCIISGIRPQIAQTIVHLGVDLSSVTTKATMAGAFLVALQRLGMSVSRKADK